MNFREIHRSVQICIGRFQLMLIPPATATATSARQKARKGGVVYMPQTKPTPSNRHEISPLLRRQDHKKNSLKRQINLSVK